MVFPKRRGPLSEHLSRLAKARGVPPRAANQVVRYELETGRFWFLAEAEEQNRWRERSDTEWLLDLVQSPHEELLKDPEDRFWRSLPGFIAGEPSYAKRVRPPKPTRLEWVRFCREVAREIRKFLIDRQPMKGWDVVPGGRFRQRLVWIGGAGPGKPPRPSLDFIGGDWRTRFKLRAQQLLALHASEIRRCERCERLFLLHDRRQKFCSSTCAKRAALDRFKGRLGPSKWKKKRRAYYEASKAEEPETMKRKENRR